MTDKKLTPRVGDRVIVSAGEIPGSRDALVIPTTTGSVDAVRGANVAVVVDAGPYNGPDRHWWFPFGRLTVVDREPVEWPKYVDSGHLYANHPWLTAEKAGVRPPTEMRARCQEHARCNAEAWAHVADRWDEFVWGES
jgi:hypothetical protein